MQKGIQYGAPLVKKGFNKVSQIVNPAERLLTSPELLKLNTTLAEKGILPQQKTIN
ncbi:MAG: hypothetical protein ACOH2V_00075 [Candidatus Saccharimonadaceae bacterium]